MRGVWDTAEPPPAAGGCQGVSGGARGCQGMPGDARECQGMSGGARGCQRRCQRMPEEMPGGARECQEMLGDVPWSSSPQSPSQGMESTGQGRAGPAPPMSPCPRARELPLERLQRVSNAGSELGAGRTATAAPRGGVGTGKLLHKPKRTLIMMSIISGGAWSFPPPVCCRPRAEPALALSPSSPSFC